MSVKILESLYGSAVLYCSTTEWAFGPVFRTVDDAREFLVFCPEPRLLSDNELVRRHADFKKARVNVRSE